MKKILMTCMALLMLGGCATQGDLTETKYNFPIVAEDLSKIINEENLPWTVGDEIVNSNKGTSYYVKNENGNNTIKVYSDLQDEFRVVKVDLLSSNDDPNSLSERLEGETIPNMFTMTARIYGMGTIIEANKVYDDVIKYMKDRNATEYGKSVFESKYGDNYFSVGMTIKEDNYNLDYIRIDNKASYENSVKELADIWYESLSSVINVKKDVNIKELRDTVTEEILVVKGRIEKQSKLPEEKAKLMTSMDSNGNKKNVSRQDYVDAVLVNGEEKISIILKINGLGKEEIEEERTHYIYYSPENTVGIAEYSI